MNKLLPLAALLVIGLLSANVTAQSKSQASNSVSGKSSGKEFVGSYKEFLKKNLRYPDTDEEIHGAVKLRFTVEKNGTISEIVVEQSLDPLFDEEAIRVIKLTSGKWTAPKEGGHEKYIKWVTVNF